MNDIRKTKPQLIAELNELRRRVIELEAAETERQHAEEALRENESKFRGIVEHSTDGIVLADEQGNIIEWNPGQEWITGLKRAEVVGQSVWEVLFQTLPEEQKIPAVYEYFRASTLEFLRKGQAPWLHQFRETESQRPDGTRRVAQGVMFPIKTDKGFMCGSITRDITERQRAEETLREAEENFRALAENAITGILVAAGEGTHVYANKQAAEITGYSVAELLKTSIKDLAHPDEIEKIMERYRSRLEGKPVPQYETIIVRKDGKSVLVEIAGTRTVWKGKPADMVFVRDITERKRAEAALRESESKYRTLIENIPQKIFTKDRDSVYVSCNENFARDLGIKPDQCAGKTDYDFFPRELADKYRADDKRIMEAGQTEDLEEKYLQAGQEVWVQTIKTPIQQEEGRVIGILGVFWDITERKRAEEAIRYQANLLEQVSDAIISTDMQFRAVSWNHSAEKLYGWSADEIVGKSLSDLVAGEYPGTTRAQVLREFGEQGRWTGEVIHHRKDGSPLYLMSAVSMFKDNTGKTVGMVSVNHDITKRKRAEEEIRQLNRDLDRRNKELLAINQAGRAVASTLDLNTVLQRVIGEVRNLLDAEGVSVLLQDGEELVFAASVSIGSEGLVGTRMPASAGIAGWVLKTGESALVGDAQRDSRFYGEIDALTGLSTSHLLAAPLTMEGVTRGVIEAINKTGGAFNEDDLRVLESVAASAAIAVENARLYEAAQHELRERKRAESQREAALEALRESEEKWRSLVSTLPDYVSLLDREGRFLFLNHYAEGFTEKEVIGSSVYQYLSTEFKEIFEKGIAECQNTGKIQKFEHIAMGDYGIMREYEDYLVPILEKNKVTGTLVVSRDITERKRAVEERERLTEQLRQLTHHVQSAREDERTVIAREIHDEFGQALTALKMDLSWLSRRLPQAQPALLAKVDSMLELVDTTVHIVRRIVTDLRPGLLDDLGLIPAMEWQTQEFARRTGLAYELRLGDHDLALDPALATTLFRILQEALTNISRHAGAARVEVELDDRPGLLTLVVRDDGKGIDPAQVSDHHSLGLLGMRERARVWGGDVVVAGTPGQGTTVTVRIPHTSTQEAYL